MEFWVYRLFLKMHISSIQARDFECFREYSFKFIKFGKLKITWTCKIFNHQP
jgi:hypothetical protein